MYWIRKLSAQQPTSVYDVDFAEVRGQKVVKRALEIAAAGGHNILMVGSPGSGKLCWHGGANYFTAC